MRAEFGPKIDATRRHLTFNEKSPEQNRSGLSLWDPKTMRPKGNRGVSDYFLDFFFGSVLDSDSVFVLSALADALPSSFSAFFLPKMAS